MPIGTQLWFIPVAGGAPGDNANGLPCENLRREYINAQWVFQRWPTAQIGGATRACPEISVESNWVLSPDGTDVAVRLQDCHGSWKWTSWACDDEVQIGGQLAAGVVFARQLPQDNTWGSQGFERWNKVEIWCKFRLPKIVRFDSLYLSLNGPSMQSSTGNILPLPPPATFENVWLVAHHLIDVTEWDDDGNNLRAVLTATGTTTAGNVGLTIVDIEWFAMRLTPAAP
ncbi:hypothetical protein IIA79_04045 [bacterium]|nr:hypothetical protein [bacterium]